MEALSSDLTEGTELLTLILDSETLCGSEYESEDLSREDRRISSHSFSLKFEFECGLCGLLSSATPSSLSGVSEDLEPLLSFGLRDSDLVFSFVLLCLISICLKSS